MKRALFVLSLAASLLIQACGDGAGGSSAPRSRDANANKVLNLCESSGNYAVFDVEELSRSGLVDLIKKNLKEDEKKELDGVTKDMGIDPFQSLSVVGLWGKGFDHPEDMHAALTTSLPADKVDKALKYLVDKAAKEAKKSGADSKEPEANIAILGAINRDKVVELAKKSSKTFTMLSKEGDLTFYEGDQKSINGFVDQKAVLVGRSKEQVKSFWNTLSGASTSASGLLKGGEILKWNVAVNSGVEVGISKVSGSASVKKESWDIQIQIVAINAEKAQQIKGMAQMMSGMLMMARENMDAKLKEVLSQIKVDIKDKDVHISLSIPKSVAK